MSKLNNIIDCPIIIHPGFPKAASTFLQTAFFTHIPRTLYIGSPLPRFPKEGSINYKICNFFHGLKEFLFNIDEKIFYQIKDNKIKNLQDSLRDIVNNIGINNIDQIIYSDEGLTDISSETKVSRLKKAERLKLLFKDPHFIFVIRKQDHLIESLYGGYIKNKNKYHPFCKFNEFIKNACDQGVNKKKTYININSEKYFRISVGYNRTLELPKFNKIITYYENNFSKSRINVLLFEDLISKKNLVIDNSLIQLNLDDSKSINSYKTNPTVPTNYQYCHLKLRKFFIFDIVFRIINKLKINKILMKIFPLLAKKKRLFWDEESRYKILELYKPGNQEISKKYNLDLKSKGYPI